MIFAMLLRIERPFIFCPRLDPETCMTTTLGACTQATTVYIQSFSLLVHGQLDMDPVTNSNVYALLATMAMLQGIAWCEDTTSMKE